MTLKFKINNIEFTFDFDNVEDLWAFIKSFSENNIDKEIIYIISNH